MAITLVQRSTFDLADNEHPVTFYRVQVGPFAGKTEAARIRDRLRSEEGLGPFITR